MSDDEEEGCPHGMGEKAWCSICLGKVDPKPDITWSPGAFGFPAKYHGSCVVCKMAIVPGNLIRIRYRDEERTGVAHSKCVEE